MLKICLVFWESERQYAYKRYAYKKKHVLAKSHQKVWFDNLKYITMITLKTLECFSYFWNLDDNDRMFENLIIIAIRTFEIETE